MHAKVSIPAWAKPLLTALGIAAVIALTTSPIWRRRVDQCAVLSENIEVVRTGGATSRVSDAWIRHERREKYGWSRNVIVGERGNFGGYISQFTLRTCLGEGWIARPSETVHDAWVSEALVYRKSGWPNVYYLSGIDHGERSQVVIVGRPS